jgi:hypothetical protein
MIIKKIICKFKKHIFVDAGACPFTGNTYVGCTRCNKIKSV